MMTAIMTFVLLISRILISLGNMFGAGSVFGMLWAGFAPLTSLILVHLLFTKVFKMPSPVTIGGARAWHKAGASGALGTAAAAGVGAGIGSGIANALGRKAKSEGRRAGSAALHKATGGRLGNAYGAGGARRSAMGAGTKSRERDVEAEEAAQELTPGQVRKQVVADRKSELASARAWHKDSTGSVAAGDFRGLLGEARSRVAQRGQALAQSAQSKIAATPLAMELHSRADHRRALRSARTSEDLQALQAIREEQRAKVGSAAARMAAVMDAPTAAANRARLGVQNTAQKAWNSPKVVGARADAAILAGGAAAAGAFVRNSDVGKGTVTVARYASKPVAAAARGASAVANRSKNNAELIENYRASLASRAAPAGGGEPLRRRQAQEPVSAPMPGAAADVGRDLVQPRRT